MKDVQMLMRRTRVAVQKSKTCNHGRESRCRSGRRAIVDACRGAEVEDVQSWTRRTRVAFRTPRLYRRLSRHYPCSPPRTITVTLTPSRNAASHVPSSSPKQKTLSLSSAGDGQGECESHRRLAVRRRIGGCHRWRCTGGSKELSPVCLFKTNI